MTDDAIDLQMEIGLSMKEMTFMSNLMENKKVYMSKREKEELMQKLVKKLELNKKNYEDKNLSEEEKKKKLREKLKMKTSKMRKDRLPVTSREIEKDRSNEFSNRIDEMTNQMIGMVNKDMKNDDDNLDDYIKEL